MDLYPGRWRAQLLPLCSPSCTCSSPGKLPHEYGWQRQALARFENYTEAGTEHWVERVREHVRRGGNVGLALPAFTAALDVDTDLEGEDRFDGALARDAILELCDGHPVQLSGKTHNGMADGRRVGVHVFGKLSERVAYGNRYAAVPVTVRHVGHQVVVAPSRHLTGLEYEWIRELPRDPMDLPEFEPTWFGHVACAGGQIARRRDETDGEWRARVSEAWRRYLEDPEVTFQPGQRHEALLWRGWHLVCSGGEPTKIQAELFELAATRCVSGGRFGPGASQQESRALAREIDNVIRTSLATLAARRAEVG